MSLQDIERIAKYQQDNWKTIDGEITDFDLEHNTIKVGGVEFTYNQHAGKNVFERLNMLGAAGDFDTISDRKMLQKIVDYCIINKQKTDSRVIYDTNNYEAKAVKSDRYTPVGNYRVLQKAIAKYEDSFHEKGSFISDERMILNFGNIETREVKGKNMQKGDVIGFGSQIWNSDVGLSSLGVGQFMIRLACTNGMTSRESINVSRIAHTSNDLMEKLAYAMETIINPERMIKVITRAMERPAIVEDIRDFTKIIKGIPNRHIDGIVFAHNQEPIGVSAEGVNGWGIYNAITRYATHLFPHYETFNNYESNQLLTNAYPLLTL